jgi:hypothetical protein
VEEIMTLLDIPINQFYKENEVDLFVSYLEEMLDLEVVQVLENDELYRVVVVNEPSEVIEAVNTLLDIYYDITTDAISIEFTYAVRESVDTVFAVVTKLITSEPEYIEMEECSWPHCGCGIQGESDETEEQPYPIRGIIRSIYEEQFENPLRWANILGTAPVNRKMNVTL